jgi:Zn-dependent metalloprotease
MEKILNARFLCFAIGMVLVTFGVATAQQRREIQVDTFKIKEIELGSTLDYIRFDKTVRIEANDFIKNNPKLFFESDKQKMVLKKTEEDELGFTHYRYGKSYMGIPIEDADYWIHSKDGVLTTANGKIVEIPSSIVDKSKLTQELAVEIFKNQELKQKTNRKANSNKEALHINLLWASREKDTTGTIKEQYYLAYKIENHNTAYTAYINTESAMVTYDYYATNSCQPANSFNSYYYGNRTVTTNLQGGLYRMQDICPSVCANLNKNIQVTDENDNLISNISNTWTTDLQRKAATSQWAASNTYNYFCEKHNWKGYDNNNSLLTVKLINAFDARWYQTSGLMEIGNYGNNLSTPYCTQDVIAHEFTHGVVIKNTGISGVCNGMSPNCDKHSINESVADMLATSVESYSFSTFNFLIGENVVSDGIRNMGNPKSKLMPNCYPNSNFPVPQYWTNKDVYGNGAVSSFWFYLI